MFDIEIVPFSIMKARKDSLRKMVGRVVRVACCVSLDQIETGSNIQGFNAIGSDVNTCIHVHTYLHTLHDMTLHCLTITCCMRSSSRHFSSSM